MEAALTADTSSTVASLMRQWRGLLGLNTAEAGARLGLSGRTIEDIEQGRKRSGDELARIALEALIREAERASRKPTRTRK